MDKRLERAILDAIEDKGVDLPCPRCDYTRFEVVADTVLPVTSRPLSAYGLAVAVVACRRCGFLSFHALKPLLDPNSTAGDEPEEAEDAAGEPVGSGPAVNGSAPGSVREPAAAGVGNG